jgi:hypothetical protein
MSDASKWIQISEFGTERWFKIPDALTAPHSYRGLSVTIHNLVCSAPGFTLFFHSHWQSFPETLNVVILIYDLLQLSKCFQYFKVQLTSNLTSWIKEVRTGWKGSIYSNCRYIGLAGMTSDKLFLISMLEVFI